MSKGITLTELLIALGIIALISVFAIPKVLETASQDAVRRKREMTDQTIQNVIAAYGQLRANQRPDANTTFSDITPYMHYIAVDTTTLIDGEPTQGSRDCGWPNIYCLKMPQGGLFFTGSDRDFNGTDSTNALTALYDPDGEYSGSTSGPGKAILIFVYYNGKVKTWCCVDPNTTNSWATYNPDTNKSPEWWHNEY